LESLTKKLYHTFSNFWDFCQVFFGIIWNFYIFSLEGLWECNFCGILPSDLLDMSFCEYSWRKFVWIFARRLVGDYILWAFVRSMWSCGKWNWYRISQGATWWMKNLMVYVGRHIKMKRLRVNVGVCMKDETFVGFVWNLCGFLLRGSRGNEMFENFLRKRKNVGGWKICKFLLEGA